MGKRIFAFFDNNGYYFNNGEGQTVYKNIPPNLETHTREISGPSAVTAVYGGMDGHYLLKTRNQSWSKGVPSGWTADNVKFIAWGPDSQQWTQTTSGRTTSSNLPQGLRDKLNDFNDVTGVSFGPDGKWALVREGGGWNSHGAPSDMVNEIRKNGSGVKKIVLCPWDEDYYWLEMKDGSVVYYVPKAWTPNIDRIL